MNNSRIGEKPIVDFKAELNQEQMEAVISDGVPLLVVAGAGSGKTRVITYRIAHLIKKGVCPWNILAVTFTNKAAGEMKARIYNLLGEKVGLNIGTFHSVCARMLRNEIERIGLKSNFVIYDALDQKYLIKQICKELNLCKKTFRPNNIAEKISSAKNRLLTPDVYKNKEKDYYSTIVSKVYDIYHKKLRSNNAMDFDDIILYTVKLLKEYPEVLLKYQNKFKSILVDEYQDTNHAQYRLIQLLAGDGNNLCVVGDPDQSIYRWRGADIMNIMMFEEDYPNAKVINLEQNYRSTQSILGAANNVIENNVYRKHKNLWSKNDFGDPVSICNGDDELDEANFVVNKIGRLAINKQYKYSDIVIFYRMHAQSRVFEDALRFAGIPYDIVGGVSFYERKEIKDIVAYLNLVVCPDCEVSMRRIINVPNRGIGKSTIEAIAKTAKEKGKTFNQVVWDSLSRNELPPRILKKVNTFAGIMSGFKQMASELTIALLLQKIINKIAYFDELKKDESGLAEVRIENVKELVSAAEEYSQNAEDTTLAGFLEGIALVSNIDKWDDTKEKVTLMTMHSAKGLEFGVVIMVGMEEGIFPHASSLNNNEQFEEERRLCYVGMTRAKSKLVMCYMDQRMIFGRTTSCIPSRFLMEIPDEFQEHITTHPGGHNERELSTCPQLM